MKKITLLLLLIFLNTSLSFSQQTTYYRLATYSTAENACNEDSADRFIVKVNINSPTTQPLNLESFYYLDLGNNFSLGERYCKVLNSSPSRGDADFSLIIQSESLTRFNPCQLSYKYYNLSTYSTADKACVEDQLDHFKVKVHILGDNIIHNRLQVGSFVRIDLGSNFNLGVRYCKINAKGSPGDADFELNGIETNIDLYSCGNQDSDGDGVLDNQDACPNEAGDVSNNGCPLGNPDFVITRMSINAGGTITNTPNTLLLRSNQNHEFCVAVKNQGQITARPNTIALILSNSASLTNASITANLPYPNGNLDISPNQSREFCSSLYIWTSYSGYSLSSFNYIHAIADYNNTVDEGNNENNNQSHAAVSHTSSRTEFPKVILDLEDFSRITVNNKQEEEEALSQLKKGKLYLVKGKRDTQKILIEE